MLPSEVKNNIPHPGPRSARSRIFAAMNNFLRAKSGMVQARGSGIWLKVSLAMGLLLVSYFFFPNHIQAKTLTFQDKTWQINPVASSYIPRLTVRNDLDLYATARVNVLGEPDSLAAPLLNPETAQALVQISSEVDQTAHDAQLVITGNHATTFDPGQNGQSLDLYQLRDLLLQDDLDAVLPVIVAEPKIKLADTNELGIKELVGEGISNFTGSPHNRIINIGVGAAKYNGVIVAPGAEFSFNGNLGDVDAQHGFLPELVIKPDGVIPEFGGGLCQVSTTTFRAAMNAGLPITARRNHSFAVQYYAPQGTDATIYPGSSDLKFINNLSSSLLIATRIEGRKLYFDFYGTKDDRQISFDGPVVYDKKSDGSMKATWTRHVALNDQVTTQVFKSTYLPPALFHHDAVEQPTTLNPTVPATPPLTQ